MENYSYNSYPESGGSSPRSREIDFENPPPWDDQTTQNYKVKLMCSYGGKIHPRPHDNQLAYVGGETKILSVDRNIKFSVLVAKLATICDSDVSFKYQLPGEDLDALISVTNDDDLDHMMIEYDRLNRASPKPARLRLFLFPVQVPVMTPTNSFGSTEGKSERDRFVEALNSGPVQTSTPPALAGNADFLFGSEKVVAHAPVNVPVPVTVARGREVVDPDPVIRHHEPDGSDRIQKHIADLRRLRIAEDQQQQQQQNMYRRQSDEYAGDYYVQRPIEKVAPATLPVSGYQISGGYPASGGDQQPVYMVPAPASMYHAPMARPVTGPVSHGQTQGQGYYTVQRMSNEIYRDQPVYSGMQPIAQPVQPVATQGVYNPPPQQQQQQAAQQLQQQKVGEGIRMVQSTAAGGLTEGGGYGQVAYDNRPVYYTAQGNMVTPHQQPPPQQNAQQQYLHQLATTLSQEGKVIAPPTSKIAQGSI
uniref:uncharacterized protein LOC122599646 n=1 Tax=Erigeron canadensis TaxID=72917 RepID=UPI001CB9ACF1|nr:uncharacterized protein LOC122599646 [Erigeron canadensis]